MASMGSVLTYLQQHSGKKIRFIVLEKIQLTIFIASVLAILVSYCFGVFGGREYWEFNPVLALPIAIGWILFLINFISSVGSFKQQPVYIWMWLTGIVFFLFTFTESYLWIFPYFRNNVVNDMTVQWKSYGSMVGSWNMLVYGSGIFLMEKISGNKSAAHAPIAFVLYFTGLFNLMFNWGHHIYTLPTHAYIKHISYTVSMTELFIFGRIIYKWKSTVSEARKNFNRVPYKFMLAADVWVFLNLLLAIIMSVPAVNVFTHGTHTTVAHAMGTTIGINSFILLACAFDIFTSKKTSTDKDKNLVNAGYWIANVSLFIFWISLVIAGILKSKWQMSDIKTPFSVMMLQLRPFFISILVSGIFMITGFFMLIYCLLKKRTAKYQIQKTKESTLTIVHNYSHT